MKIEIVTPPRSGTVALFSLLEAAKMSDNANYEIITNRHEYDAFNNNDNLNLFVSRNPVDVICSIFIYEGIEYSEERCSDLIQYLNKFYHSFNKNDRSSVGYLDFNYLISNEKDTLKNILIWLGIENKTAASMVKSDNFVAILKRMKEKDLKVDINKQHFPREVSINKKQQLRDLIGQHPDIKNLNNSYINTKRLMGKTDHTVIGKVE